MRPRTAAPRQAASALPIWASQLYQPPVKTISGINVSGYFNPSQTDPADFIRNQYNLSDDFNLVRENTTSRSVVPLIRGQVLLRNQFRTSGSYSFTADVTNDALASYLLGYVRTFTQGFGEFKDNLVNTGSLYVQDDYHVSRRLTLNLGLRWDPFKPWKETKGPNRAVERQRVRGRYCSQVYINAPPGLLFPGDPGVPELGRQRYLQRTSLRALALLTT